MTTMRRSTVGESKTAGRFTVGEAKAIANTWMVTSAASPTEQAVARTLLAEIDRLNGEIDKLQIQVQQSEPVLREAREALEAMRGIFDTPVARRHFPGDYAEEARRMTRNALTRIHQATS